MDELSLLYLSEPQANWLLSWKKKIEKHERWISWCNEQKKTSQEINKLIIYSGFLESTNLNKYQLNELFGYYSQRLGNRQMRCSLYEDNGLERFNKSLRFLLNEEKPLPNRFDNFIKLRNVKIWTTSQFLAKWKPEKYPLVATSGKKSFMDKVIINHLTHSQINLAKKHSLETYRINEYGYDKMTIDYLAYQQIFNEIREILEYDSYLEVQNFLWLVYEREGKLTETKSNLINVKTIQQESKPKEDFYGRNDGSRTTPLERVSRHINVWKRNQKYINGLKKRYEGSCQFTNCPIGTFMKRNGTPYAEAHHPKPLGENGADQLGNLMILCPTHHKMFHYADWKIIGINGKTVIVTINGEENTIEFEPKHLELFKRFYQRWLAT